ncbi:MAG: ribonucleoside triphosphate reductase, partial [Candidatus Peregrinibacteria bacterium]|nr:ribonucleoside triphosphate reductase [Candidatus Peregrinibacteria bacterium]
MIFKVQKRTGEIVDFSASKVQKAIWGAVKEIGGHDEKTAQSLTKDVVKALNKKYKDVIPGVEDVQDVVEKVLIESGHAATAKSFILYRERRSQSRADKNVVVNVGNTISEYLNKLDWRVNANSNQGYSLGGMILNTSGKVTANYWLSHVYPREAGDAHRNGDFHIHDLDMLSGYCAGWSLRALLEEGFNGVPDKTESAPPKHLSTAVSQMVNFLGTLQNEWAGAQAFSSFDTYLAPFVKKFELKAEADILDINPDLTAERLKELVYKRTYKYVLQNMQSFVFNLNVPSRWGTQTPFTNITLDWTCPEDLQDKKLKLGGEYYEYKFGELQPEMDIINKAYIEVMTNGDSKGRVFTFPIPTYNITPDFNWDNENTEPLFEMTAKYGMPYFQNFLNSDLKPNHVRSMCCRLQLDLNELLARGNGLFGSAEMTGSIGVVTISTPRIGYEHKGDKEAFLNRIGHLMTLAKTTLEIKRKEVQKWIDRGLFPYTKRYLGNLNNHFSTIGINGLNEAVRNFTDDKENISTEWGQNFAEEVLDYMREILTEFQNETGNLYNLEATPAEGTTYRFAKEDKKRFPEIIQAGTPEAPYYTNSSQLPVEYTSDAFEALTFQDRLQKKYTGGTVLHLYMGERITNAESCKNLVRKVLTQFRLPYITITPTFSICPKHGYISGEHDYCPVCDKELGYTGDKL